MASKVPPSARNPICRRHTVANIPTTYRNVKQPNVSENGYNENTNDSKCSSDTNTSVQDSVNGEIRHTVANVATTFMHVMKLRKRPDVSESGDTEMSKDCESTANKRSPKGTINFKLPDRRVSMPSEVSRSNSVPKHSWKGITRGITGLLSLRRLTMSKPEPFKPKIKFENTYKMSPDFGQHFATSKIEKIAESILKEEIADRKYESNVAGNMARIISTKIQTKVKELNLPRYRIVCQVVITEVSDQGMASASRCLWDQSSDNFSTATYRNETISATAMIFGIYYE